VTDWSGPDRWAQLAPWQRVFFSVLATIVVIGPIAYGGLVDAGVI